MQPILHGVGDVCYWVMMRKLQDTAALLAVIWMTVGIIGFYATGSGIEPSATFRLNSGVALCMVGALLASFVAIFAAVKNVRRG